MSTLDGPIWSMCSIVLTCPAKLHRPRKDGSRVGMKINAHQEKEKNKETKMGKRRARETKKRKQATDFKEAVCCPSAVVQGAA